MTLKDFYKNPAVFSAIMKKISETSDQYYTAPDGTVMIKFGQKENKFEHVSRTLEKSKHYTRTNAWTPYHVVAAKDDRLINEFLSGELHKVDGNEIAQSIVDFHNLQVI